MNSRKRRNFLIASGAIAVLLAIVLVVFKPDFPSQDSSGAIGAVQKHRETQITGKDVVLGDEALKRDNRIAFGDFLQDATELRKISGQINNMSQGNRDQLQNVVADLQSRQNDLQSRYLASANDTLSSLSKLLSRADLANKGELQASVETLASSLANRNQLNAAEMANFDSQLSNLESQLENSGVGMLQGFYYGYGGGGEFSSFSKLESMASQLESRSNGLESQDLLGLTAELQSAAKSLGSRDQLGAGFALQSRLDYLGAMAVESKTLESAINQLGSVSADQLANRDQLNNIANQLGSQVNTLESKALNNMEAGLASNNQLASHLASIDRMLGSLEKLGSRANTVDNRTLESFNQALGSFSTALQSREAQFQSRAQGSMQAQLGAVSSYLGSREQLGARDASLGAFQSYLGNLSQSLENRNAGLGSMDNLANREQLASQSRELANRAAGLESKIE